MRIDAATWSGESRRRRARTGAPASARIVLQPTVRNIVLLPDMFDPLITSAWGRESSRRSLRTQRSSGSSG